MSNSIKKIKWEPSTWRIQYENIKTMREVRDAPVDLMGCESLSHLEPLNTPKEKRLSVLISLMLSSQTKDEITAKVMNQLRSSIRPFCVDSFLEKNEQEMAELLYPAGFWKKKAQYILKTARILKDKYEGDIPDQVGLLCELPGVGPKMAYITMSAAWNQTVGIGVDTHVHRIANRIGWTRTLTKTPEATRKELEDWLPNEYWNEVNKLLVGFGQQICRPIGPKCSECLNKDICPFPQSIGSVKKSPPKLKTPSVAKKAVKRKSVE